MASVEQQQDYVGEFESPGGFIFGVQGWTWGDQKPSAVTFMLDGTCRVHDQHGRPVKGVVQEGQPIYFDRCNHAQVIAALKVEGIDLVAEMNAVGTPCDQCKGTKHVANRWCQKCYHKPSGESTGLRACVLCSGWPQLPYDELKKLKTLPPTPVEELRKINNPDLRKAALRIRREVDAATAKEMATDE